MHPHLRVLVDFDGTISTDDTTDRVLQRFALPSWTELETLWEQGLIGSRECMARQIDLIRATRPSLEAFLETLPLDSGFTRFAAFCAHRRIDLVVVSDGLDLSVRSGLDRLGVRAPALANALVQTGSDRWRLAFPHGSPACRSAAGHCKCRSAAAGRSGLASNVNVLIGDGRSDFCAAGEAAMVFAKARLADHCRSAGFPHERFTDFADLLPRFERWLAGQPPALVRPQTGSRDLAHVD